VTEPEIRRYGSTSLLEHFAYSWLSNVLALFVASWAISAMTYGDSWWTLLLAALVFAIVNAILRPVFIVLGIVAIIVTLGLGLFFVNMGMLWLTSLIVPDLRVGGFWSYVGATVIIWLVNTILSAILRPAHRRGTGSGIRVISSRDR
jgi:putative membrane protein